MKWKGKNGKLTDISVKRLIYFNLFWYGFNIDMSFIVGILPKNVDIFHFVEVGGEKRGEIHHWPTSIGSFVMQLTFHVLVFKKVNTFCITYIFD